MIHSPKNDLSRNAKTERAINQLRSALSGETYTMGHTRRQAGDTWWLSGLEPETMAIQKGLDMVNSNGGMAILGTHCLGPYINETFKISFDIL